MFHPLNWIYLYDADVFFQFSILIRILDLISDPNQSRDSFIVIKLDTLYIGEGYILSLWISSTIHLIGYIIKLQMLSFNFELRPPLAPLVGGEHISLGKHVIGVHINSKDAYGREKHDALRIRALWHRNSELCPPPAPPIRGEHISLGKYVIGVHIHSKDAYGRAEHDAHKIWALRHRNSELRPPPAPPVRGEHISLWKLVIGVHIHSKDAYGRSEHDAHKIWAYDTAILSYARHQLPLFEESRSPWESML